jgi:hypothetical protein
MPCFASTDGAISKCGHGLKRGLDGKPQLLVDGLDEWMGGSVTDAGEHCRSLSLPIRKLRERQ